MLVRWVPPSEDQVALNIDGSSYGNPGRAGYGGLIRDHEGKWVIGFSGHINFADSLEVELLAILHGLTIAWNIGARNVSCRSDCTEALSLIQCKIPWLHKYASIICDIRDLISRDWSTSFIHTYRESNQCADFLAKLGANALSDAMILPVPPTCLSSLLHDDAIGTCYTRL